MYKPKTMALSYINLFTILLSFFLFSSSLVVTSPNPHAIFLKITKDPLTKQYITQIKQRTPLVPVNLTFDLSGDSLWVDCDDNYISSTFKPVPCVSQVCDLTPSACTFCAGPPRSGCQNSSCLKFPENPVIQLSGNGAVGTDAISLQSTDGSNPGKAVTFTSFIFTCVKTAFTKGLANGVKGILGFNKSPFGFQTQLFNAFNLPRIFAICLSSSTGFAIIGNGPYNVLPGIDLSQSLTYTPLISNSVAGNFFKGNQQTNEYYINVTGINVNGQNVPLNTTLLKFDELGHGGTKITTEVPYTVLERTIHSAITNAFVNGISSKVKRVKPVHPFTVCYNSNAFSSTLLGPGVPSIQLVLHQQNVSWSFSGLNSMVPVSDEVMCLGFISGGFNPDASILIGAYQLENAFLQFDLSTSTLGFASTIVGQRTTCANFNFTSTV